MKCLIKKLDQKKEAAEIERIKNLPKEIKCPKCDAVIPIELEKCPYCEFEFHGDKYQYAVNDDLKSEFDETNESEEKSSNIAAYIFSFLIPLVGFILGANLMAKDNEDDRAQGVTCIILGIVSAVACTIIAFLTYNNSFSL